MWRIPSNRAPGALPKIVRPGQRDEAEAVVLLQIFDERAALRHIGALKLALCAITDDGVEIRQCLLDGIVGARADQGRIAREPHAAAAGVGGGAAELVRRFDHSH
jgi:hypothetical protein